MAPLGCGRLEEAIKQPDLEALLFCTNYHALHGDFPMTILLFKGQARSSILMIEICYIPWLVKYFRTFHKFAQCFCMDIEQVNPHSCPSQAPFWIIIEILWKSENPQGRDNCSHTREENSLVWCLSPTSHSWWGEWRTRWEGMRELKVEASSGLGEYQEGALPCRESN